MQKKIAIFASGRGSNATSIIEYFRGNADVAIDLIVTNNEEAGVLQTAGKELIQFYITDRDEFYNTETISLIIEGRGIDLIVLAGFLWLIPEKMVQRFKGKMINIHPALLPKHGGKGMYGKNIHRTVIEAGELESGITIHFVDEEYDHGDVILQESCRVETNDTAKMLAARVLELEHYHLPRVIEGLLQEAVS
jgi:phosphoribosylglycinamide formyltransferase-1